MSSQAMRLLVSNKFEQNGYIQLQSIQLLDFPTQLLRQIFQLLLFFLQPIPCVLFYVFLALLLALATQLRHQLSFSLSCRKEVGFFEALDCLLFSLVRHRLFTILYIKFERILIILLFGSLLSQKPLFLFLPIRQYFIVLLIVLMSNPLIKALTGIGSFFYRWSLRITKIAKHRLLTKRKNILLFGQANNPLYQALYVRLQPTWQITRIHTIAKENIETQLPQINKIVKEQRQEVSNFAEVQKRLNQVKDISIKKDQPVKQTFYKEYLLKDNYTQLQKQLQGKQFDSILVIPQTFNTNQRFNFEDQNFAVSYPQIHQKEILRNVFAYRLANKYLTTTGSFILSASERDFLKSQSEQTRKNIKSIMEGKWWPSVEVIDAQSTYLGVVVGQRDYTDLNSWGLVALSREWIQQDLQFVARNYAQWAQGQKLPMPGSFALFKRRAEKQKKPFIEYI